MPGCVVDVDELVNGPIAVDHEMRRHSMRSNAVFERLDRAVRRQTLCDVQNNQIALRQVAWCGVVDQQPGLVTRWAATMASRWPRSLSGNP